MSTTSTDVCPVCDGTGRGNPLPVPRTGPGPCRHCDGTGKRTLTALMTCCWCGHTGMCQPIDIGWVCTRCHRDAGGVAA